MRRITRISIATLFLLAVGVPCLADEAGEGATTSALETLDYLALFGYMAIIVIVGIYFARGEKTTDDYFLAGRRVPWWAATLSIFSTYLSAITFMAIPATAFNGNWITVWMLSLIHI